MNIKKHPCKKRNKEENHSTSHDRWDWLKRALEVSVNSFFIYLFQSYNQNMKAL